MMHWNAIVIGPVRDGDVQSWLLSNIQILEQENTPYAGGAFTIDILFSNDYPFKAPKVVLLVLLVEGCVT